MPRRNLGEDSKGPGRSVSGSNVPTSSSLNTKIVPVVNGANPTLIAAAAHNRAVCNHNYNNFRKKGANVHFSKKNVVTGNKTGRTVHEKGVPVWSNKSVSSRKSLTFHIPFEIMKVLNALNDEYNSVEFSILGKAEKHPDKESHIVMSSEFYVPKQKVSAAHIDYEEDAPEYNVVIHKHPDGCRSFSGTDDEYINANFDFSLLWVNRKFEKGHARINTTFGFISVPIDIEIDEVPKFDLTDEIKSKIIQETPAFQYRGSRGIVIGSSWADQLEDEYDAYYQYNRYGGYGGHHGYGGQSVNPHYGTILDNRRYKNESNINKPYIFHEDDNEDKPIKDSIFDQLDKEEKEWSDAMDNLRQQRRDEALNEDGSLADYDPDINTSITNGLDEIEDDILIEEVLDRGFEIIIDDDDTINDDDSTDINDRFGEDHYTILGTD